MGATHEGLVDRARQLAPSIAERAHETELLPKPHGGTVGEACLSTGRDFAFYSGQNWMAVKHRERAQEELFADKGFAMIPVSPLPSMSVKPTEGGLVISGRATWGSGIVHADWACFGADRRLEGS